MKEIRTDDIISLVERLCITANTSLNPDIETALRKAYETETAARAKDVLSQIIENAGVARNEDMPICQDTGMAVAFVEIGQDARITGGNITEAINEGVRRGYKNGYLRKSVVRCPIDRINTNDNTPAVIHYDITNGDSLKITIAPKGFGSENKSRAAMLNPADGYNGVKQFIVKTVIEAGADACPPVIAGVGVGGTMEKCALLAKRALLREVGYICEDPLWARAQNEILNEINAANIGPAGLGGKTTALAVNIETFPTHIAGLPVAVNIGCHVTRHAEGML